MKIILPCWLIIGGQQVCTYPQNAIHMVQRQFWKRSLKTIFCKACDSDCFLFACSFFNSIHYFDSLRLIQDPLSQRLIWTVAPSVVLVIKKMTNKLDTIFCEIIEYLINVCNGAGRESSHFYRNESFKIIFDLVYEFQIILRSQYVTKYDLKDHLKKIFAKFLHKVIEKNAKNTFRS